MPRRNAGLFLLPNSSSLHGERAQDRAVSSFDAAFGRPQDEDCHEHSPHGELPTGGADPLPMKVFSRFARGGGILSPL
jgi:hypothetical protein